MNESMLAKLTILAEAAKYDVSCSSSGAARAGTSGGIGSAVGLGICHSFTDDGRCVSLLKILLTNHCIYDCAYCINRRSNDIRRAAFSSRELAELTIAFYRRNYIEGLFLSSGVVRNPDHTMEQMINAVCELRKLHKFNGYIHMKSIPGASRELVRQAGLYADRLSVNIEIPSEATLKYLAPEKDHQSVYLPMRHIRQGIEESREERSKSRLAPIFVPAGQSTQMIIGASSERDNDILRLASMLYHGPGLKRVYYSGFIPVNPHDARLPALTQAPLVREHRLYQADWLMRFYHFAAGEIVDDEHPDLDLEIDPKLAWALRHPEAFPLDVNTAEYAYILRVPGIGLKSAQRIVVARRHRKLGGEQLARMGVVMKRARYFLALPTSPAGQRMRSIQDIGPCRVRTLLTGGPKRQGAVQLSLFGPGDEKSCTPSTMTRALTGF